MQGIMNEIFISLLTNPERLKALNIEMLEHGAERLKALVDDPSLREVLEPCLVKMYDEYLALSIAIDLGEIAVITIEKI